MLGGAISGGATLKIAPIQTLCQFSANLLQIWVEAKSWDGECCSNTATLMMRLHLKWRPIYNFVIFGLLVYNLDER